MMTNDSSSSSNNNNNNNNNNNLTTILNDILGRALETNTQKTRTQQTRKVGSV